MVPNPRCSGADTGGPSLSIQLIVNVLPSIAQQILTRPLSVESATAASIVRPAVFTRWKASRRLLRLCVHDGKVEQAHRVFAAEERRQGSASIDADIVMIVLIAEEGRLIADAFRHLES